MKNNNNSNKPSLIFGGKATSLSLDWIDKGTQVSTSLACKYKTRVEIANTVSFSKTHKKYITARTRTSKRIWTLSLSSRKVSLVVKLDRFVTHTKKNINRTLSPTRWH